MDLFLSNHNAYIFKVGYSNYRFLRLFFGLREMVALSHGTTVKTVIEFKNNPCRGDTYAFPC